MGETIEAALVIPAILLLILLFLLQGPRILGQVDHEAREAIGESFEWVQESGLYEVRGARNLTTQPERLAQILDLVEDMAGRFSSAKGRRAA